MKMFLTRGDYPLRRDMFSEADVRQIEAEGLTLQQVLAQINLFEKGVCPVGLNRPCSVGDGIVVLTEEDMPELIALCENGIRKGRMVKFVPASGAASRMFREWFEILDTGDFNSAETAQIFARNLKIHAFFNDLNNAIKRNGESLEGLLNAGRHRDVLSYILTIKGLNYGYLPKALLKFHRYPDGDSRTALEEHLVEAILYTQEVGRVCRIHFTVSEEYKEAVSGFISEIKDNYESHYGVTLDVTLSTQRSYTNTIAADMENRPFRDPLGRLVFRPGGHGSLLENLNDLDGDIIFLKNIDNIVPDRLKSATVRYKKVLGGYLIRIQDEVYRYLRLLEAEKINEDVMKEILTFCSGNLKMILPPWFQHLPLPEKCLYMFDKLNRPIRVCGMVQNEGEPGGGPFWVDNKNGTGTQSLQIIEESQVDQDSPDQKAIWAQATHFNPVDLVCGVRDFRFRKFNLHEFVDGNTFYISKKSEKGQGLKALELPGLWNGAMAFWNTIFVEVPTETFNPVKTVDDLLRPQHSMDG
jgi:hypothetical protein